MVARDALTLKLAAAKIGYTPRGMREIIERSRLKTLGYPVSGPTIQFQQAGKGRKIVIREEWIEEFNRTHTIDPAHVEPVRAVTRKARVDKPAVSKFGLDPTLWR